MDSQKLPRRAYFAAEDHAPLDPNHSVGSVSRQQVVIGARNTLAQNLIVKAEQVAAAVKTARTYDTTGNIPASLPHLDICVEDLINAHAAFTADVRKSLERHDRRARMTRGLDAAAAAEAAHPAGAGRAVDQAVLAECLAKTGIETAGALGIFDGPAAAAIEAGRISGASIAAPKPGPQA